MPCTRATSDDLDELRTFLLEADLTVAGLDSLAVQIWLERGPEGGIIARAGRVALPDPALGRGPHPNAREAT